MSPTRALFELQNEFGRRKINLPATINLIFPYRKSSKSKPYRSCYLLLLLQIILLLTGNRTEQNKFEFNNEPGYDPPFTPENILKIFSSEQVIKIENPFHDLLKLEWFTCEKCDNTITTNRNFQDHIQLYICNQYETKYDSSGSEEGAEGIWMVRPVSQPVFHQSSPKPPNDLPLESCESCNKTNLNSHLYSGEREERWTGMWMVRPVSQPEFHQSSLKTKTALLAKNWFPSLNEINKLAHINYGNRSGRGKAINFLY